MSASQMILTAVESLVGLAIGYGLAAHTNLHWRVCRKCGAEWKCYRRFIFGPYKRCPNGHAADVAS